MGYRRKLFSDLLGEDVKVAEASEQLSPEEIIEEFVDESVPSETILQSKLRKVISNRFKSKYFNSGEEDDVILTEVDDNNPELEEVAEEVIDRVPTELFSRLQSALVNKFKDKYKL